MAKLTLGGVVVLGCVNIPGGVMTLSCMKYGSIGCWFGSLGSISTRGWPSVRCMSLYSLLRYLVTIARSRFIHGTFPSKSRFTLHDWSPPLRVSWIICPILSSVCSSSCPRSL